MGLPWSSVSHVGAHLPVGGTFDGLDSLHQKRGNEMLSTFVSF